MTLTYEELEAALVSYLQLIGRIDPNNEFVVNLDLDIALNDDGLVEFDLEVVPLNQREFNFG